MAFVIESKGQKEDSSVEICSIRFGGIIKRMVYKRTIYKKRIFLMLLIGMLCIVPIKAKASNADKWQKEWDSLCYGMEQDAKKLLEKEITSEKEDLSSEEKSTTIKNFDVSNAIPMWTLYSDLTMLSDYHKNNNDFSKLIKWDNRWYIPAETITGTYASILLQREKDGYHIYGQYFDKDDNYIADNASEIKEKIKKKLPDTEIEHVMNVSVPFYKINLIYIKQSDEEEMVIPYQADGADTLDNIGEKSGTMYSVSKFISDMENVYQEYTEEELEKTVQKNKEEMTLGGALEPKNKVSQVKEKNTGNSARYIIFATGIAIIAVFGVIVYIKKVK